MWWTACCQGRADEWLILWELHHSTVWDGHNCMAQWEWVAGAGEENMDLVWWLNKSCRPPNLHCCISPHIETNANQLPHLSPQRILGSDRLLSLSMAQGQSQELLPPLPDSTQTEQPYLNSCLRNLLFILAWRQKKMDSKYKGCHMIICKVGSLACREMGVGPKFSLISIFTFCQSLQWTFPEGAVFLICSFGMLGCISQWSLYCAFTHLCMPHCNNLLCRHARVGGWQVKLWGSHSQLKYLTNKISLSSSFLIDHCPICVLRVEWAFCAPL